MSKPADIAWVAADWGTTHLRLSAIGADGDVLGTRRSGTGMACLEPSGFEPALIALADDWFRGAHWPPVVACGMLGSRQGWIEAPYRAVPTAPMAAGGAAGGLVTAPAREPRLRVGIVGGLRQDAPADVMRGEETQIAGFLALNPGFDGVLCLPGTHGKWARVRHGLVESFQTFMTGELFALLSETSVLRHSVATGGWDEDSFAGGLATARAAPERVGAELFGLRAGALLHGLDPVAARARLSGLLIGSELAAARGFRAGAGAVAVIGAKRIGEAYCTALGGEGIDAPLMDAENVTLAGLRAAWAICKEDQG